MVPFPKYVFFLLFLSILATAEAQKPKTPNNKPAPVQKFKPPKLICSLGGHADSAVVPVNEMIRMITLPLAITDDKKNIYSISSYQVMYKRRGVTEDEETGKVSPTTSNVASLFRSTPLPDLWKNIISEQLKPGEEIFFFDIIAKDAQGRLMFAPDLKIRIR